MYQCQNCGGTLKYDIATQQMRCEYCDSAFDPYTIKKDTDAKAFADRYFLFQKGVPDSYTAADVANVK